MISICTVIYGDMEAYIRVLKSTVRLKTKHVHEMIIVQADASQDNTIKTWNQNGVTCKIIGYNLYQHVQGCPSPKWADMVCGHAMGLHHAIEQSSGEYVMLSDPDVFFLDYVDDIYLSFMARYNLDIIGVSHFNPTAQCYQYFPCIINCLMRRDKMPPSNWLQGQLWVRSAMQMANNPVPITPVDGKYLIPGPIPELYGCFPSPHAEFDAGCNLWLWNHQQGGRWLAFHLNSGDTCRGNYGWDKLMYPLNYNTRSYNTNFGLTENLGRKELLYHRTRGARISGLEYHRLYDRVRKNI